MTTTYSPNLRLSIIGDGEQAGAWGNTTNANLGTLVEGAISGYQTVALVSTSQALTALNGAADQARMAIVRFTTALTSALSVFVPPTPKQYTFFNDTTVVVTVYCSTVLGNTTIGGDGVAIPAGGTMTVWSTGAPDLDVKQQNTHLISPTMASPVMSGTPLAPTAVAGTDTLQVASTAFVQAAILAAAQALHPVGSIYINATNSANPATLLGFGTWTAFGAGRVPVGFDSTNPLFDASEETGGSADAIVVTHTHTATTTVSGGAHTHTGTTDGGGSHSHSFTMLSSGNGSGAFAGGYVDTSCANIQINQFSGTISTAPNHTHAFTTQSTTPSMTGATVNANAGASGTNANYQPYITVYMWKRTA